MAGFDLNNNPEYPNSPSLRIDPTIGGRSGRYANPFFDLSQQYMPPTMTELLRWCTFYYYNSPLIGSAITKMSRYPITDLIIEDEHESVRSLWSNIYNKVLKIKNTYLEINLDYHVYGNSFISMFLPFTRFLICKHCKDRIQIRQADWSFNAGSYDFRLKCKKCGTNGAADVKDINYKDIKGVKIIRWSPENIRIKCNEYTGRKIYMYIIPYKLKNAVMRGDKDIVEDMPMIVLEAIKNRRMIRFNNENFYHLKRPTLAEQDQGWGKPLIIHVLKDMFYLYTLRRAQEAIAQEHIVPFDIIYPMPNAQQDPYIHTDLAGWRTQIETIIAKHRRDPNYKAVIPIPVGFGRLGGDGKAMLLTPELNMLAQQIVGGMGIPIEFLMGGLTWSGSSVSLRTLENDFIQNRTQLLDLTIWIKDKLRYWLSLPNIKDVRFADFRMADDIQRNQQLIGLNAQMKVSDQTLLTELGYDYDQEIKKMIEEVHIQNYLNDIRGKSQAKTQGETMIIQQQYQDKIQKLIADGQAAAQERINQMGGGGEQVPPDAEQLDPGQMQPEQGDQKQAPNKTSVPVHQEQQQQQPQGNEMDKQVETWASKLLKMQPHEAQSSLMELKARFPDIGVAVEKAYNIKKIEPTAPVTSGADANATPAASGGGTAGTPNMNPLPEGKGIPRRQGAV
jgi:hypothetical protein